MEFGRRLRDLRKQKGMTLETLAVKIGSSKGYLSGIENEKVNPPTEKFVRKLARIFGQDEIEFLKMAYLDKIPRSLQPEFNRSMGSNAAPAKPAASGRQRPGEASGVVSNALPLLNSVSHGYPNRIASNGFPEPLGQDRVAIPGVHPTHTFAITVCGSALVSEDGISFKEGDIAVVSRAGKVEDGDFVFAIFTEKGQRQGQLRQVMLQDGETVALQATNRTHPIIFVKRSDLEGMFKVIGKIEIFSSAVTAAASRRDGSGF
jgi:transcriptional regulator with XRE-family HTH domain